MRAVTTVSCDWRFSGLQRAARLIRSAAIDFLVDFDPSNSQDPFHRYFGLNEALERLQGRNVDLVMVGALKNPYFIESVNQTRQLVYAAPVAQTA